MRGSLSEVITWAFAMKFKSGVANLENPIAKSCSGSHKLCDPALAPETPLRQLLDLHHS